MPEQTFQAEHFINRELSWLEFNARVLEEAEDPTNPLLGAGASFWRSSARTWMNSSWFAWPGLREQAFGDGAPQDYSPDGHAARHAVAADRQADPGTRRRAIPLLERIGAAAAWPPKGFGCFDADELDRRPERSARPFLSRAGVSDSHADGRRSGPPQPALSQPRRCIWRRCSSAAAAWARSNCSPWCKCRRCCRGWCRWARATNQHFILLEEAVSARLAGIVRRLRGPVLARPSASRRDSDIELLEQESDDMLRLIEDRLKARQRGQAVRLEVAAGGNEELIRMIIEAEAIRDGDGSPKRIAKSIAIPGPLDLTALMELTQIPDRESASRSAVYAAAAARASAARQRRPVRRPSARHDILLHHPYDSFDPVVEFVSRAANDPQRAGHQADALPHQRRFAGHAGPDSGGRKRQARHGPGRAQGPLRRSRTT